MLVMSMQLMLVWDMSFYVFVLLNCGGLSALAQPFIVLHECLEFLKTLRCWIKTLQGFQVVGLPNCNNLMVLCEDFIIGMGYFCFGFLFCTGVDHAQHHADASVS